MIYIEFLVNEELIVSGYITYIGIDRNNKTIDYGIKLEDKNIAKISQRAEELSSLTIL